MHPLIIFILFFQKKTNNLYTFITTVQKQPIHLNKETMDALKIVRSSDLCRTVSPKMQMKNKKRRKSSSAREKTAAEIMQELAPKFELGLNYVKPIDNNGEEIKLPRKFTNPKRKTSIVPKLSKLSLSDSDSSDTSTSSSEKEWRRFALVWMKWHDEEEKLSEHDKADLAFPNSWVGCLNELNW